MSESLSSRTEELQAVSTEKLKMAVGLLTGHTTLRAHMFKPGFTLRQDCQLCGDKKEDSVCIVCLCLALACKRYGTLDGMFLTPKGLENMRMNGLIILITNARLGIIPSPHIKIVTRYRESIKTYLSLGT
jgi:hypothetical protein